MGARQRYLPVDHEEKYLRAMQVEVGTGLPSQSIEFLFRPLRLQRTGGKLFYFYSLTSQDLNKIGMVDLLLMDGPPHYFESREASLYLMRANLRPGSLILLDDGLRKTREQQYFANWKRFFNGQLEGQLFEKSFESGLITMWPVAHLDREVYLGHWIRIKQAVLSIKVAVRHRLSMIKKHVITRWA